MYFDSKIGALVDTTPMSYGSSDLNSRSNSYRMDKYADDLSDLGTPQLATPSGLTPTGEESEMDFNIQRDFDRYMGGEMGSYGHGSAPQPVQSSQGLVLPVQRAAAKTAPKNTYGSGKDPEELTDAVAAAGVNLRAEEEAMAGSGGLSVSRKQLQQNHFLQPKQLAWFMSRTMEQQGMTSGASRGLDADLINLMSSACESYMSTVVSDSVVMSRHRRRGLQIRRKQAAAASGGPKSEVSRALKDIAVRQKHREEKRVQRRIALGLEEAKKNDQVEEQTQTNITASLMMSGSMKKRYSWMQTPAAGSAAIGQKGENGIRYREAREEPGIVMRDLLAAMENRKMGVSSAIVKGYAKLRD